MTIALLSVVLSAVWALILTRFRQRLLADWREPVLSVPVLIVESDDWGPGPAEDARRLNDLAALLQKLRDRSGQAPVVTLGIVLAAPGTQPRECQAPQYLPVALDAPELASIREAMLKGRDAGVFALQLHCMEHFWPSALLSAAMYDPQARSFLRAEKGVSRHEVLPSHLQARWIDTAQLPSVALDLPLLEFAVAQEVACFSRVFGAPPRVVVPVAFSWTKGVEAAWARHGIGVIVTPGTRNVSRDAQGRLVGDGSILRNGDLSVGGMIVVVRDIYFEPTLGHTAAQVLPKITEHARLGRPALLEMHRFNFIRDDAQAEQSLDELRNLLTGAVLSMPRLRFMSTEALAETLRRGDPSLTDRRLSARVRAFVLRAATEHKLRRLAMISGLALVAVLVLAVTSILLKRKLP